MRVTREKFLLTPNDTKSNLYDAKEAWENFEFISRLHASAIQMTISTFESTKLTEIVRDPSAYERFAPLHLEVQLNTTVPDFVVACNGLRRALDGLQGSHLVWNTETRKSAKHMDYEEDEGWVLGNMVGPHPAIGGFAILLEIADNPDRTKGIYLPFDSMISIRNFDTTFFE